MREVSTPNCAGTAAPMSCRSIRPHSRASSPRIGSTAALQANGLKFSFYRSTNESIFLVSSLTLLNAPRLWLVTCV